MNQRIRAIVLGGVALLALTGCIRMEMAVTLHPDDTADGSMLLAIEKGSGELMETTDEELLDGFASEAGADFDNSSVEPFEDDEWIGQRITFTGQPITSFDESEDGMRIYREGDEFVVAGNATGDGEEAGSIPGAIMTMSVTFPGEVSEHNGTLEGTTVTWDLVDGPGELMARGAAEPGGSGLPWWIWAAGGAVVLVGAGIAAALIISRRPAPVAAPADAAPAAPAAMPGAPLVPPVAFTPEPDAAPADASPADATPADADAADTDAGTAADGTVGGQPSVAEPHAGDAPEEDHPR